MEKQKKFRLRDYIKALFDAYRETQIKKALYGFYQKEWIEARKED